MDWLSVLWWVLAIWGGLFVLWALYHLVVNYPRSRFYKHKDDLE